MKKILALMLSIAMLCLLCACSSGDKTSNSDSSTGNDSSTSTDSNNTNNPNISPEETVNVSYIDPFCGDLARFKADTGYGYMDKTGKIVIEAIYDDAQMYFDDALAKVSKNGVDMFIDKTGKVLFEVDFEHIAIGDCSSNAFWVETMEETLSGQVHTMTYYKYDGNEVTKAFSIDNAQNEGEDSNFYTPDPSIPDEKYALIDGYFIDFNGNRANFSGLSGTVMEWHENWVIFSHGSQGLNYGGYIDFATKSFTNHRFGYNDDDYRGYGKYLASGYYWGAAYSSIGILTDVKIENNQIIGTYLDVSALPDFANASVKQIGCGYGDYFTVYLMSPSGVYFSAVIDSNGNIVIQPTKDITLAEKYTNTNAGLMVGEQFRCYTFSENGLCKAKDNETGLFGFIDINGNWVIEPSFLSVTDFTDGENPVAVVDGKAIINDKGEIVRVFGGWTNEILTSLSGTYRYDLGYGYSYTLFFYADGTLKVKEYIAGSTTYTGQYVLKGSEIILSGFGIGSPLKNGTYPLIMDESSITFNSFKYTLVQ